MISFADGHRAALLSLVDHNENKEFEAVAKLTQIIDHHKPSRELHELKCEDVDIQQGVGSCCTLVGKRYLASFGHTPSNGHAKSQPDVQIALMLYGAIILGMCGWQ